MLANLNRPIVFTASALVAAMIAAGGYWYSLRTQPTIPGINPEDPSSPTTIKSDYGNLPLSFEPNKGQTDSVVKFLARSSGYALFLTSDEAVFRFQNKHNSSDSSVLRMSLKDANRNPQVTGLSELPGKTNYFIGNDPKKWRTNIPTYAKVKYESIYPGVDLIYHSTQSRQLEYDFVVAVGGDPHQIKLSFSGADEVELLNGDLVIKDEGREMRMHKPVVYQEKDGTREVINGQYTLNNEREVGFEIASYDRTRDLIIDPVIAYSTFLGGTGEDTAVEIVVSPLGNAYITGLTTSIDFPMEAAGARFGTGGGSDVFVTKFNAAGNQLLYSTYLGGSSNENYYDDLELPGVTYGGIAIDVLGQAYVTGSTRSSDFPTTGNAFQQTLKGLSDTFVTKLSGNGNALAYSTYLGQNGVNAADGGQGIAVDGSGQAYVTGHDYSGGIPVNGFSNHSAGVDGYIVKVNSTGPDLSIRPIWVATTTILVGVSRLITIKTRSSQVRQVQLTFQPHLEPSIPRVALMVSAISTANFASRISSLLRSIQK
jgi:hypothetical protein